MGDQSIIGGDSLNKNKKRYSYTPHPRNKMHTKKESRHQRPNVQHQTRTLN